MITSESNTVIWHSSYSAERGNCVQVASAPDRVLVHDSKDPDGPTLTVPAAAWRTFLTSTTR
ncbi:MAG: DUF397 domain-containing protein [Pseudonocardiaceae bacterium]